MNLYGRQDFEGYVYLDIDHPLVAWNTARGVYCSVDCLGEDERESALSLSMANMMRGFTEDRLKSEMAIEFIRTQFFPEHVSRLRGIFVFDDIDSISRLWYGCEWGAHFQDNYMTDVGISANKSCRLDANWIMDIMDTSGNLKSEWLVCAKNYWRGDPHPTKPPVWERIVEGWVTIWGTDIKKRALNEISKYWPQSLKLLEYSCNAAAIQSNDGVATAFLTTEEDHINIRFYLRMIDAKNKSTFERMEEYFQTHPEKRAISNAEPILCLPDMSHLSLKIPFTKPIEFVVFQNGRVETNLQRPIK
jgi:hypothetical protein